MSDEMSPEMIATLRDLWQEPRTLRISMHPRDAWIAVAVIQFASRNPQLGDTQRDATVRVGRAIQGALLEFVPAAAALLEDGWNPEKDVPR